MKKYTNNLPVLFICLSLILCISDLSYGQDFEGIIYYEIPEMTDQGMGEMPYMVKDSKVRMEFGEGTQGGAMIFMPEKKQMTLIMEPMKGYMTMDIDDAATENESGEMTDMEKTGETKTIAGKSCEVWEVTDDDNTFQLCVAKGMGTFMMPRSPMAQSNTPQWAKEAMAGGFMPLEVVDVTGGSNEMKMRATKIEEKSLSADLFEIPQGYKDMSGMMKQMMNQNKNQPMR